MTAIAPPAALALTTARLTIMDDPFAQGRRALHQVPVGRSIAQTILDHWPEHWPQKAIPLTVIRNGVKVDNILEAVEPGDHLAAYPTIDDAITIGTAIVNLLGATLPSGATFSSLAAATSTLTAVGVAAVGTLAISGALYAASALLAKTPSGPNTGQQSGSNTYRWDGVTTDYAAQGAPKPVLVGERTTGGSVISYVVKTRNGASKLRLLLWISHGLTDGLSGVQTELDGASGDTIPEGSLWINDVDVNRWGRLVRVWTRNGGLNQSAIPGFNDQTTIKSKGLRLKRNRSVTHRATQGVDELDLTLLFDKGLVGIFSGGEMAFQSVKFRYRVREWVGGVAQSWPTTWTRFIARGKSTSPFPYQESVEFPHRGDWEIELERLSPIATDLQHKDDCLLQTVTEVVRRDFVKPGAALLALEIEAAEGLAGNRPQVEAKWRGWLAPIWDGASTTSPAYVDTYTRNPFWICLGMLRDTIWGAGEALRSITFDIQDWSDGADSADGLVYADLTATLTKAAASGANRVYVASTDGWAIGDQAYIDKDGAGEQLVTVSEILTGILRFSTTLTSSHAAAVTVKKYHARFRFDAVLDQGTNPWELAQAILATARSRITKVGNKIILVRGVARDPVMLVSEGNVRAFKMRSRSPRTQPTRLDVIFDDVGKRYGRDSISVQAEDVILDDDDADEFYDRDGYLAASEFAMGITRVEQARRHGAYRMRTMRLSLRSWEFELPLEGLAARDGDRIEIAHRKIVRTVTSGRITEDAASGAAALKLDRQIVIASGTTYALTVRIGDDTISTLTVTKTAGTWPRGTAISISGTLSGAVDKYAPYSFGVAGSVVVSGEVIRHGLLEDLVVEVQAQEYSEAALADA